MGERGREIKGARRKKRESIQRQENTTVLVVVDEIDRLIKYGIVIATTPASRTRSRRKNE